jgi:hypothetical protein
MNYIPNPPTGLRVIFARRNGGFGEDDRSQHPQYYCDGFVWACCIPNPTCINRPYLSWTPTLDDCFLIPGSSFGVAMYLIRPKEHAKLKEIYDDYANTGYEWLAKHTSKSYLGQLLSYSKLCLDKLRDFGMTFKEVVFSVAEFRRTILDIHGFLAYVQVYQPRTHPTHGTPIIHNVNTSLMGAFTESFKVAHELFQMGIPVWLLRPSKRIVHRTQFGQEVHLTRSTAVIENFVDEKGHTSPFPELYRGLPGSAVQQSMQRIGCRVRDLLDVSAIGLEAARVQQASAAGPVHMHLRSFRSEPRK